MISAAPPPKFLFSGLIVGCYLASSPKTKKFKKKVSSYPTRDVSLALDRPVPRAGFAQKTWTM